MSAPAVLTLAAALSLVGCSCPEPQDSAPHGDTGVEDTGVVDTGDTGVRDTGINNAPAFMTGSVTTTTASGYRLEQALAGSAVALDGMDQAFSITHTTLAEVGDCDEVCDWVLPDGSYTMGHDADYLGDHGQGAIFLDDQLWFLTIPEHDGHDVWFWFSHDGFGSFEQEGYWDFG